MKVEFVSENESYVTMMFIYTRRKHFGLFGKKVDSTKYMLYPKRSDGTTFGFGVWMKSWKEDFFGQWHERKTLAQNCYLNYKKSQRELNAE
jgi:hypothetical protein